MSAFKQLSRSDVFTIPYIANKQWSFSFDSIPTGSTSLVALYEGQKFTGSLTLSETTTSLSEYKRLIYNSINHQFYQSYSGSLLDTSSLMKTLNNYQSASQNRPTASYFIYNDKAIKSFPSGTNSKIQVFSIAQAAYGENILPYSLQIRYGSSSIADDGIGNLYSGSVFVGNVFYSYGTAIFTNQSYQTITYPLSISFQNQYTVYENYIACKLNESEFNLSYNPTLLTSGSETTYKAFATGSDFNTYATTVGLYNSNNDLLMVAKFAQPMLISSETDMTLLIRYDS